MIKSEALYVNEHSHNIDPQMLLSTFLTPNETCWCPCRQCPLQCRFCV